MINNEHLGKKIQKLSDKSMIQIYCMLLYSPKPYTTHHIIKKKKKASVLYLPTRKKKGL